MNFIEQYFGNTPENLTYKDIESFFNIERVESDKIEFKSYVSGGNETEKENGIIRSICGFLNSSGGLIVWGAPIGRKIKDRNDVVFTGSVSPLNRYIQKDYFINRITDSITPAPNFIYFHIYESEGNYLYLIEVMQSDYSPHQFKNVYYMRIDGQTKPAPHHYIEALFKKITFPKLKGFLKFDNLHVSGGSFVLNLTSFIFNTSRLQNEYKPYSRIVLGIGAQFSRARAFPERYFMDGHERRENSSTGTIYYNQPFCTTDVIQLNANVIQKLENNLEVSFYFAGEKSPLLLSKYTLHFNFQAKLFQISNQDENRYYYEHSDDLGLSEEQRINDILGRT